MEISGNGNGEHVATLSRGIVFQGVSVIATTEEINDHEYNSKLHMRELTVYVNQKGTKTVIFRMKVGVQLEDDGDIEIDGGKFMEPFVGRTVSGALLIVNVIPKNVKTPVLNSVFKRKATKESAEEGAGQAPASISSSVPKQAALRIESLDSVASSSSRLEPVFTIKGKKYTATGFGGETGEKGIKIVELLDGTEPHPRFLASCDAKGGMTVLQMGYTEVDGLAKRCLDLNRRAEVTKDAYVSKMSPTILTTKLDKVIKAETLASMPDILKKAKDVAKKPNYYLRTEEGDEPPVSLKGDGGDY